MTRATEIRRERREEIDAVGQRVEAVALIASELAAPPLIVLMIGMIGTLSGRRA